VRLAEGRKNKSEAHARFAELLTPKPAADVTPPLTVNGLVEAYRTHIREKVKPPTYKSYDCILKQFVKPFGDRAAESLSADELEAWARKQSWSQTTQRYGLTVINGIYKWAVRPSRSPQSPPLMKTNPIQGLNRPPGRSRGTNVLIDDALHERVLSVSSQQFKDFITVVRATGARPGEVACLEAQHIVWDAACWILTEHKTAASGRLRTVFIPQAILPLLRLLAEKYPEGPIFRTTRGEQWRKTGWKQAMERAQGKLGLVRRPLTSGYRHTFATDALEAGVPDTHVAELLGHSSTAMVAKHYGHLAAKARVLRESLSRFRSEKDQTGENKPT
jgi:integrase